MASLLLLIKIFCMVVYRVGEYSRRAGGFAGGYRRVVDEFTGVKGYSRNLPTIINFVWSR